MTSGKLGKRISQVEVTNVSSHGFWLLIGGNERFLAFEHFPWFRDASIKALTNVELPSPHHLYWPELDVDIAVESIDHPDRFPLVSKARSNKPSQRTRKTARRQADRRHTSGKRPCPESTVPRDRPLLGSG